MEIEEVNKRILEILECEGDEEVIHIKEDKLYYDFIEYVSNSKEVSKEIQNIAKMLFMLKEKVDEIGRWHA